MKADITQQLAQHASNERLTDATNVDESSYFHVRHGDDIV